MFVHHRFLVMISVLLSRCFFLLLYELKSKKIKRKGGKLVHFNTSSYKNRVLSVNSGRQVLQLISVSSCSFWQVRKKSRLLSPSLQQKLNHLPRQPWGYPPQSLAQIWKRRRKKKETKILTEMVHLSVPDRLSSEGVLVYEDQKVKRKKIGRARSFNAKYSVVPVRSSLWSFTSQKKKKIDMHRNSNNTEPVGCCSPTKGAPATAASWRGNFWLDQKRVSSVHQRRLAENNTCGPNQRQLQESMWKQEW